MRPDTAHVVGHQPVAALGHHRHVFVPPDRRGADAEMPDAQRFADGMNLGQMVVEFRPHLVHRRQWRPGQFQLPTGFKADVRTIAGQADDLVLLEDG